MPISVIDINSVLRAVYGPRGLPFPGKPITDTGNPIAGEFKDEVKQKPERTSQGSPYYGQNALGRPVFMPATINEKEVPNALIMITGEKEIVETNVVDVGTVFERIYQRPYDVTIIATLINADNVFPEEQLREMLELWNVNEVVTLKCALTDLFLQADDNLVITKIDVLDMQGIENTQVIQIAARSNIDFELELK